MADADGRRAGALVLSLDFELAWGVRGRGAGYDARLRGARAAIPRLLSLFEDRGVAATWATVGFLFADSREELAAASPPASERPRYEEPALDPYGQHIHPALPTQHALEMW